MKLVAGLALCVVALILSTEVHAKDVNVRVSTTWQSSLLAESAEAIREVNEKGFWSLVETLDSSDLVTDKQQVDAVFEKLPTLVGLTMKSSSRRKSPPECSPR